MTFTRNKSSVNQGVGVLDLLISRLMLHNQSPANYYYYTFLVSSYLKQKSVIYICFRSTVQWWNSCLIMIFSLVTTPTPWLTWTRFMQISVTCNLKMVPIPHLLCTIKLLLSENMMSGSS